MGDIGRKAPSRHGGPFDPWGSASPSPGITTLPKTLPTDLSEDLGEMLILRR